MNERTAPFQGLRLIGIITIVAGHAGLNLVGGGNWCTFFFLLSGFLYKAHINTLLDYWRYLKHKGLKLYPIYWFCLLLYLLLALVRGCEEQYSIDWDFLPHLFLLQSWIPGIQPQAYLGPAWFLSSLLFCYCASPGVKYIVDKGIWTILIIIGCLIFWKHTGLDSYISPLYRLIEYSLGIWLHKWLCVSEQRKEPFSGCILYVIIGSLIFLHFGVNHYINLFLLSGIICIVYSFKSPIIQIVLGNSYVIEFAKSDIFIYLTHPGIGFHLVFFFISHNSIIATIGSVIVGYLIYKVFAVIISIKEFRIQKRI